MCGIVLNNVAGNAQYNIVYTNESRSESGTFSGYRETDCARCLDRGV